MGSSDIWITLILPGINYIPGINIFQKLIIYIIGINNINSPGIRRVKKLKLNIQKTKIMASGPITSWQIDRWLALASPPWQRPGEWDSARQELLGWWMEHALHSQNLWRWGEGVRRGCCVEVKAGCSEKETAMAICSSLRARSNNGVLRLWRPWILL